MVIIVENAAPGQNTDGQNTDGQNTDGENALEHESGKDGQIQFFGPACNFSVDILSICVMSWSHQYPKYSLWHLIKLKHHILEWPLRKQVSWKHYGWFPFVLQKEYLRHLEITLGPEGRASFSVLQLNIATLMVHCVLVWQNERHFSWAKAKIQLICETRGKIFLWNEQSEWSNNWILSRGSTREANFAK